MKTHYLTSFLMRWDNPTGRRQYAVLVVLKFQCYFSSRASYFIAPFHYKFKLQFRNPGGSVSRNIKVSTHKYPTALRAEKKVHTHRSCAYLVGQHQALPETPGRSRHQKQHKSLFWFMVLFMAKVFGERAPATARCESVADIDVLNQAQSSGVSDIRQV